MIQNTTELHNLRQVVTIRHFDPTMLMLVLIVVLFVMWLICCTCCCCFCCKVRSVNRAERKKTRGGATELVEEYNTDKRKLEYVDSVDKENIDVINVELQ